MREAAGPRVASTTVILGICDPNGSSSPHRWLPISGSSTTLGDATSRSRRHPLPVPVDCGRSRRRGHQVTCAARGESGDVPAGARHVVLDRAAPDWSPLDGEWDAVVDVARTPSWVRDALDALAERVPHWTFVSTISVYAEHATPGGSQDTLPVLSPITDDVEQDTPEAYGASKVACEQGVQARAREALVVRPGLIVGPGDPSGRFSYWPERLAEGGPVLAPESPDLTAQVIDVRDLAGWLVTCAENRLTGVYDAPGASPAWASCWRSRSVGGRRC